jgi:hypothetical protein
MQIDELKPVQELEDRIKLKEVYLQFEKLLTDLRTRELSGGVLNAINKEIQFLNAMEFSSDKQWKVIKKVQFRIIKLLEKELKIVPKNYYVNQWVGIGMTGFGIPLGVAFGISLKNMAYLGLGIPIGIGIGSAIGSALDKKALKEGRQLDLVMKS